MFHLYKQISQDKLRTYRRQAEQERLSKLYGTQKKWIPTWLFLL
ncbi:hypothetical protein J2S05_002434 [Alkalicoccobacillus murimartini]|uniref:YqzE family protein n=1 Tax=Alkalicoccobacillus murimartini TaxID=171685 RepID=A0ABT9YIE3_9BACI|nr:hypothetical protein [Alkalicoccobacillus murimartini]